MDAWNHERESERERARETLAYIEAHRQHVGVAIRPAQAGGSPQSSPPESAHFMGSVFGRSDSKKTSGGAFGQSSGAEVEDPIVEVVSVHRDGGGAQHLIAKGDIVVSGICGERHA